MSPETDNKLVFATNSPALALGLDLLVKNYSVICIDDNSIVDYLLSQGVKVLSLERILGEHGAMYRNTHKLLSHPVSIKFIKELHPTALLVFKNSSQVEQLCFEQNWELIATKSSLGRRYENKLVFPKILHELNLAYPELEITKISDLENVKLSTPFVLQFAKGFAGRTTHLITNLKELLNLTKGNESREVKISKYIPGYSFTINACVTPHGILASDPFFQITGLANLTPYKMGSCGQDWEYRPISEDSIGRMISITQKIGQHLQSIGYKGIYGLDFVVSMDEKEVFVIEINPRLVASIPFFTDLQILKSETPMILWHLFSFGWLSESNYPPVKDIEFNSNDFLKSSEFMRKARSGAQLILHNLTSSSQLVSGNLKAGIYNVKNNNLVQVNSSIHITDINENDEFIVLPAGQGQLINPGVECARIQFKHSVLSGNNALSADAQNIVDLVYRGLDLQESILPDSLESDGEE